MAYISVHVDMADFDTDDLVSEIIGRLCRKGRKGLAGKQIAALKAVLEELNEELGITGVPIRSIDDQMKRDAVLLYWDKYSSSQFEAKLK